MERMDIDPEAVRAAHRKFVTGVTIVTTEDDGVPLGLAVNAFTSVSLSPPLILVCVSHTSSTYGALFRADSLDSAMILELPTTDGAVAQVKFGAVIGAILTFLIVAAVVYFVFVLPMNVLKEHAEARRKAGEPKPEDPETELTLLSEIRDLLAAERTGSGAHRAE